MYYVIAIHGRPIVLAQFEAEGDALRDYSTLSCPSLVARIEGEDVRVLAARELWPAQIDAAFLEAVKRVCRRLPSGPSRLPNR